LIELINFSVNQIATIIDITVRIAAATPIFFDLSSFCFTYFHTYQSPKGGKNKLTEYTVICLDNDTEGGLSLCGFPQLGHAKASSDISCPHSLHFISAIYFILSKNRPFGYAQDLDLFSDILNSILPTGRRLPRIPRKILRGCARVISPWLTSRRLGTCFSINCLYSINRLLTR